MDKRKRTMTLLLILCTAAFLLCLHPNGIVMYFLGENGEKIPHTYAHYSMMPLGYGNWGPMITFISTAAATILSLALQLTKNGKLFGWIRNCGIAAIVGSTISLMLCGTMTVFGMAIFAFNAVAAAFANDVIKE